MRTSTVGETITAKTLVAWVSLANLTQQAGGVLTLENPSSAGGDSEKFDSIVYAEGALPTSGWREASTGTEASRITAAPRKYRLAR